MQRKRERIRQKTKVKNLSKLFCGRNPRICLCSFEQQEDLIYLPFSFPAQRGQRYVKDTWILRKAFCSSLFVCRKFLQYTVKIGNIGIECCEGDCESLTLSEFYAQRVVRQLRFDFFDFFLNHPTILECCQLAGCSAALAAGQSCGRIWPDFVQKGSKRGRTS